jgi:hypothetical protein
MAWQETTVWMLPHPGQLKGFSAVAEDLAVRLSWPVETPELSVEVQRKEDDGAFSPLDLQREGHLDLTANYGHQYAYRARLVRLKEETRIPGPWTEPLIVRVEDYIPPPPPAYLDASLTPQGIRISWESRADDSTVLGYYLYRRISGESGFTRLGGLFTENIYLDQGVEPGKEVRYRVTAVDTSPQANESLPSPEAGVFYGPIEPASSQESRPDFADPGL